MAVQRTQIQIRNSVLCVHTSFAQRLLVQQNNAKHSNYCCKSTIMRAITEKGKKVQIYRVDFCNYLGGKVTKQFVIRHHTRLAKKTGNGQKVAEKVPYTWKPPFTIVPTYRHYTRSFFHHFHQDSRCFHHRTYAYLCSRRIHMQTAKMDKEKKSRTIPKCLRKGGAFK